MIARLGLAAAVALLAVGCSSNYVTRADYDREVGAMKDYITTLERRNEDLEKKARGWDAVEDMNLVATTQDQLYKEIAETLKKALAGFNHDGGDVNYDAKSGKWTMGTDLLFDSGSWKVSPRGVDVLKKFADAHRGKEMRFRVVGHTDNAKIVKTSTKDGLDTDTNLELSMKRAVAVVGQLIKSGMSERQFHCEGMGNTQPVAPNDRNAANMKKNRRVEIFVLK